MRKIKPQGKPTYLITKNYERWSINDNGGMKRYFVKKTKNEKFIVGYKYWGNVNNERVNPKIILLDKDEKVLWKKKFKRIKEPVVSENGFVLASVRILSENHQIPSEKYELKIYDKSGKEIFLPDPIKEVDSYNISENAEYIVFKKIIKNKVFLFLYDMETGKTLWKFHVRYPLLSESIKFSDDLIEIGKGEFVCFKLNLNGEVTIEYQDRFFLLEQLKNKKLEPKEGLSEVNDYLSSYEVNKIFFGFNALKIIMNYKKRGKSGKKLYNDYLENLHLVSKGIIKGIANKNAKVHYTTLEAMIKQETKRILKNILQEEFTNKNIFLNEIYDEIDDNPNQYSHILVELCESFNELKFLKPLLKKKMSNNVQMSEEIDIFYEEKVEQKIKKFQDENIKFSVSKKIGMENYTQALFERLKQSLNHYFGRKIAYKNWYDKKRKLPYITFRSFTSKDEFELDVMLDIHIFANPNEITDLTKKTTSFLNKLVPSNEIIQIDYKDPFDLQPLPYPTPNMKRNIIETRFIINFSSAGTDFNKVGHSTLNEYCKNLTEFDAHSFNISKSGRYVACSLFANKDIYILKNTEEVVWHKQLSYISDADISPEDDFVIVSTGSNKEEIDDGFKNKGHLYCYDIDGKKISEHDFENTALSCVFSHNGKRYFVSVAYSDIITYIHAFDINGNKLWKKKVKGEKLFVEDDKILVCNSLLRVRDGNAVRTVLSYDGKEIK